jgi:hypothetical protein
MLIHIKALIIIYKFGIMIGFKFIPPLNSYSDNHLAV